jgi:uncharacterized protein (TIGR03083 family)
MTDAPLLEATTVDEVGELVTTLLVTPPTRMTACRGWTVHELVAHLAAGAAEEASLISSAANGEPARPTRTHAEREQPFRDLPDEVLRERLVDEAGRLTAALDRLGDAPVLFTGRWMTAADFQLHSRMECALHRWDIVGGDEVGRVMLAQPELTRHSLTVLGSMTTLPEAPGRRLTPLLETGARLVFRSLDADDVVCERSDAGCSMTLEPVDHSVAADVELDAAARLLLLWGRREPSAAVDVRDDLARRVVAALWSS